jgi:hypothetical protein
MHRQQTLRQGLYHPLTQVRYLHHLQHPEPHPRLPLNHNLLMLKTTPMLKKLVLKENLKKKEKELKN